MPTRREFESQYMGTFEKKKPLADQFAELIADIVPKGHIYTGSQRAKFDTLYRQLSEIDERKMR